MKVQNVNISPIRNNFNFSAKKENRKGAISILAKSAMPRSREIDRFQRSNLLVVMADSIQRRKNKEINDYLYDSKKELKELEKEADTYKKLCLNILKAAKKSDYQKTMHIGDYDINFGYVNSKTNKPSSINIWKNSKPVRQYAIFSLKPDRIEVYDRENKNNTERKFIITDEGLLIYISTKNKTNEVEFIMPIKDGFYKLEGSINPKGEYIAEGIYATKRKEINYNPQESSFYTEYTRDGKEIYKSDEKNKKWNRYNIG